MNNIIFQENEVVSAGKLLEDGGVLVFPTETVWGIGVRHDLESSYQKLIAIKRRSPSKPISLMVKDVDTALSLIEPNKKVEAFMRHFLPGPLTVLVKAKKDIPYWNHLGTGVIGIRVPDSPFVASLLKEVSVPCLVTSANIAGEKTATSWEEAYSSFEGLADGFVKGKCGSEVASTIVDATKDHLVLIREGVIPFSQYESFFEGE